MEPKQLEIWNKFAKSDLICILNSFGPLSNNKALLLLSTAEDLLSGHKTFFFV